MSVLPNIPVSVRVRLPLRYPRTGATAGSVSPPVLRPYRGRCRAVSSPEWTNASIQSRTRARTPLSIGSIQSSKSRDVGRTSDCKDNGFCYQYSWRSLRSEPLSGIPFLGLKSPGDYVTRFNFHHLPDGTLRCAMICLSIVVN